MGSVGWRLYNMPVKDEYEEKSILYLVQGFFAQLKREPHGFFFDELPHPMIQSVRFMAATKSIVVYFDPTHQKYRVERCLDQKLFWKQMKLWRTQDSIRDVVMFKTRSNHIWTDPMREVMRVYSNFIDTFLPQGEEAMEESRMWSEWRSLQTGLCFSRFVEYMHLPEIRQRYHLTPPSQVAETVTS